MLAMKCIIHPTDFSEQSAAAFSIACALAQEYGARLIVLHAAPLPPVGGAGPVPVAAPPDAGRQVLEAQLGQIQALNPGVHIDHRLELGDPASRILEVAREVLCDLIVMGTHGRTGLGRLLMGSVAEKVVRGAPCPVITVRSPLPEAVSRREVASSSSWR